MGSKFSDKIFAILQHKVEGHNDNYSQKLTLNQLIRVYKRGEKITKSMFTPSASTAHWAMARVNLFLKLAEERKVDKTYQKSDDDILKGTEFSYAQEQKEDFWKFDQLDFTVARTDLLLAHISDKEANQIFKPPVEEIE
jgi:hypothetical protein